MAGRSRRFRWLVRPFVPALAFVLLCSLLLLAFNSWRLPASPTPKEADVVPDAPVGVREDVWLAGAARLGLDECRLESVVVLRSTTFGSADGSSGFAWRVYREGVAPFGLTPMTLVVLESSVWREVGLEPPWRQLLEPPVRDAPMRIVCVLPLAHNAQEVSIDSGPGACGGTEFSRLSGTLRFDAPVMPVKGSRPFCVAMTTAPTDKLPSNAFLIEEGVSCDRPTWQSKFIFYAFPDKSNVRETESFCVIEEASTSRSLLYRGRGCASASKKKQGWQKKFVFFAYTISHRGQRKASEKLFDQLLSRTRLSANLSDVLVGDGRAFDFLPLPARRSRPLTYSAALLVGRPADGHCHESGSSAAGQYILEVAAVQPHRGITSLEYSWDGAVASILLALWASVQFVGHFRGPPVLGQAACNLYCAAYGLGIAVWVAEGMRVEWGFVALLMMAARLCVAGANTFLLICLLYGQGGRRIWTARSNLSLPTAEDDRDLSDVCECSGSPVCGHCLVMIGLFLSALLPVLFTTRVSGSRVSAGALVPGFDLCADGLDPRATPEESSALARLVPVFLSLIGAAMAPRTSCGWFEVAAIFFVAAPATAWALARLAFWGGYAYAAPPRKAQLLVAVLGLRTVGAIGLMIDGFAAQSAPADAGSSSGSPTARKQRPGLSARALASAAVESPEARWRCLVAILAALLSLLAYLAGAEAWAAEPSPWAPVAAGTGPCSSSTSPGGHLGAAAPAVSEVMIVSDDKVEIFESADSWTTIGTLHRGQTVMLAGPSKLVDNYEMVPIKPGGAIERGTLQVPACPAVNTENPPETRRKYSSKFAASAASAIDSRSFWKPEKSDSSRWVQLDLGTPKPVNGVVLQGRSDAEEWVSGFSVSVSTTGTDFRDLGRVWIGNTNGKAKAEFRFPEVENARYVRIVVRAWRGDSPAMRAAVLVCKSSGGEAAASPQEGPVQDTEAGLEPSPDTTNARALSPASFPKAPRPALPNNRGKPVLTKITTITTTKYIDLLRFSREEADGLQALLSDLPLQGRQKLIALNSSRSLRRRYFGLAFSAQVGRFEVGGVMHTWDAETTMRRAFRCFGMVSDRTDYAHESQCSGQDAVLEWAKKREDIMKNATLANITNISSTPPEVRPMPKPTIARQCHLASNASSPPSPFARPGSMPKEGPILCSPQAKKGVWWKLDKTKCEAAKRGMSDLLERTHSGANDNEAEASMARCPSCAVVGSSGNMLSRGLGPEIDAHDVVLRINCAPTLGFSGDVGSKTTHRIFYPEASWFAGDNDEPCQQLANFTAEGSSLVAVIFKAADIDWWKRVTSGEKPPAKGYWHPVPQKLGLSRFRVSIMAPSWMEYATQAVDEDLKRKNMSRRSKGWLSSGLFGLVLALQKCRTVDIYGFGAQRPDRSGLEKSEYKYYLG